MTYFQKLTEKSHREQRFHLGFNWVWEDGLNEIVLNDSLSIIYSIVEDKIYLNIETIIWNQLRNQVLRELIEQIISHSAFGDHFK
jgi:hypothetical protein